MPEIAILEVFVGLRDRRRKQGKRHSIPLCLALFTLAVAAGNQGVQAIGDWLASDKQPLMELFMVDRLPSYSTIRRALLSIDYKEYSCRLARFFEIEPIAGETLAKDGWKGETALIMDRSVISRINWYTKAVSPLPVGAERFFYGGQ